MSLCLRDFRGMLHSIQNELHTIFKYKLTANKNNLMATSYICVQLVVCILIFIISVLLTNIASIGNVHHSPPVNEHGRQCVHYIDGLPCLTRAGEFIIPLAENALSPSFTQEVAARGYAVGSLC